LSHSGRVFLGLLGAGKVGDRDGRTMVLPSQRFETIYPAMTVKIRQQEGFPKMLTFEGNF